MVRPPIFDDVDRCPTCGATIGPLGVCLPCLRIALGLPEEGAPVEDVAERLAATTPPAPEAITPTAAEWERLDAIRTRIAAGHYADDRQAA